MFSPLRIKLVGAGRSTHSGIRLDGLEPFGESSRRIRNHWWRELTIVLENWAKADGPLGIEEPFERSVSGIVKL